MLLNVLQAYNQNEIALIEAGTGTGKSIAYLLPAILRALKFQERTVISTNTINLQEQLVNKDIPLLLKALDVDLKAVLVKGMSNYLCLRKLDLIKYELSLLPEKETAELQNIEAWGKTTSEGSRSSLPIVPSGATWELVCAEHDTCSYNECAHFRDCFYMKARKQAQDAQLLVVNHHLLCSDLIKRGVEGDKEESGILPAYSRLIIDEAHNLEDTATDFFANHVSQMEIFKILHKLSSDKQGNVAGKLPLLRQSIQKFYKKALPTEVSFILNRLTTELPNLRWDVQQHTQHLFEAFAKFTTILRSLSSTNQEESSANGVKLRLLDAHLNHPEWLTEILPKIKQLIETIDHFVHALTALNKEIKDLKNESLNEMSKGLLLDINSFANRLATVNTVLRNYIEPKIPVEKVRWIDVQAQQRGENVSLIDADLCVAEALANQLFNTLQTVVLCSATLTTNTGFSFIRQRLGVVDNLLEKTAVTENIYDSPFDYQKQALLAIPIDMPPPSHPDFLQAAAENIWQSVQASHGNAFILFTSYSMLKSCYELLAERLKDHKYHPLKQGDTNRLALLNQFKAVNRSVLFGTDSFWEGVDVAGDALRCVIIAKLPFKVPSEPLIQARSEAIAAEGKDPFFEYSLPQAIVKFKQGFGRLIRNKYDHGCVVCLDNRILTKKYGRLFLESLPNCQCVFQDSVRVHQHMVEFYKKSFFDKKNKSII
jgi:ATP-dependent DNA helicase DinG